MTPDPLFRIMSAAFDQGGARGLLMNHLNVLNGCEIAIDSTVPMAFKGLPKQKKTCDLSEMKGDGSSPFKLTSRAQTRCFQSERSWTRWRYAVASVVSWEDMTMPLQRVLLESTGKYFPATCPIRKKGLVKKSNLPRVSIFPSGSELLLGKRSDFSFQRERGLCAGGRRRR